MPLITFILVAGYFGFWALPAVQGNLDVVYAAFWAGPFVFASALIWGWRALRRARSTGHLEMVRLLLLSNMASTIALVFGMTAWATMGWITYSPEYL